MKIASLLILNSALLLLTCNRPKNDLAKTTEQPVQKALSSDDSLLASVASMPDQKMRVKKLNNVDRSLSALSTVGVGKMRTWRSDEMGFISSTPYFTFGADSPINGQANNLAIYAESQQYDQIRQIKVLLNVNNASEANDAKTKYTATVVSLLKKIDVPVPEGLKKALRSGEAFAFDGPDAYITNEVHQDKIDWYRFIVASK